jgi:tetratricopeptide (TPR) repeat protein
MGLFDKKQKKEIERLEEEASKNPSPQILTSLIKKLWEMGNKEKALRIAQDAIGHFPESDNIFDLYSRLRKDQSQNEIETLRKLTEERPTPAAFAQLAEIYKDLRDEESALRYCRQAIEKFPHDDSTYRIIGELRLRRFYKDFLVKDGQLAIENLEKAFEINSKNYKSLLALAKMYLQIGAVTKARQRLKSILLFAPEDETVKKILDKSNKIAKPLHEDVDILLQMVEEKKGLLVDLQEGGNIAHLPMDMLAANPEIFQKPLEAVKNFDGLQCVIICDKEGTLIAHYAKESIDYKTYYEVASSIYQTVQDSSRQMDLGRFQRVQIEGAFGSIQIVSAEGVVYVGFGAKNVKGEQIHKYLQKLISVVSLQTKQGT